jgi:hypothetical protein
MTPKEILKRVVQSTYNFVDFEDLTWTEKQNIRFLVDEGVMKINPVNDGHGKECRINLEYFAE